MTSTSAEAVVLRDLPEDGVSSPGASADLRTGTWTRLAGGAVLGDAVTETTLTALADQARAAGHAQGYAAGWAAGRRRASEAAQQAQAMRAVEQEEQRAVALEQQRRLTEALTAAAQQCADAFAARSEEISDHALDLALMIAEAVLQRELAVADEPGLDAVRRALAPLDPTVPVTVRLHPADRAALDPSLLDGRPMTVVDDPTLAVGDARAETADGIVDATIAGAMARVREVLGR